MKIDNIYTDIEVLNRKYLDLDYSERIREIYRDFDPGKILVTSSFGSTSVVLLDLINKVNPGQVIHFIDTSYHFDKTLAYRDELVNRFDLEIKVVRAGQKENKFTRNNELWKHNPNLCCFINKVDPMDKIKPDYDVWVSGLLGFQNKFRNGLKIFENKSDILKAHPIIDFTREDVAQYVQVNELPVHPLVYEGYDSIGCTHCTQKGDNRNGRWIDSPKTECGLHV